MNWTAFTIAIIGAFVAAVVADMDAYLKWRDANPGAKYDLHLALVRVTKSTLAAGLVAAGISGVSA